MAQSNEETDGVAANAARHFYEALRGQPVRTEQTEIGGAMLAEIIYGGQAITIILQDR